MMMMILLFEGHNWKDSGDTLNSILSVLISPGSAQGTMQCWRLKSGLLQANPALSLLNHLSGPTQLFVTVNIRGMLLARDLASSGEFAALY